MANLNTAITPSPVITSLTKGRVTASGYTGNVTVSLLSNPSFATLGGTLTVPSVAGVATFTDLTLNRSGIGFTLRAVGAEQGGVTPRAVVSRPFSIPTQLVFTTQPTGVTGPDEILPPFVVTVRDSAGNTDTEYEDDITVSLYTGAANGVLSGLFTRAAENGVATFTGLSIDENGTYSFRAEGAPSLTAATPSPKVSNTFGVGFTLVAAADTGVVGFVSAPPLGSLTPSTFDGQNIIALVTFDPSGPTPDTTIIISALVAQSFFTSLTIGSTTLLSDNAAFQQGGGNSIWSWPGADLISVGTFQVAIV